MYKILVVDDDPKVCKLYEVTLKKAGYSVKIAYNAIEGLKAAIEERPDVIISDYMMPDLTGEQFCEAIRNHTEISTTPFIIITGNGSPRLKTEGLSKLFDDYLEKPVDLSYLTAKIKATLRRKQQERSEVQKKSNWLRTTITALIITLLVSGSLLVDYHLQLKIQTRELAHLKSLKQKYDLRISILENELNVLGSTLDNSEQKRLTNELRQLIRKVKAISQKIKAHKQIKA